MSAVVIYVAEGWWHPNCLDGRVHDHTDRQSAAIHRLCEPVYTKRTATKEEVERFQAAVIGS